MAFSSLPAHMLARSVTVVVVFIWNVNRHCVVDVLCHGKGVCLRILSSTTHRYSMTNY